MCGLNTWGRPQKCHGTQLQPKPHAVLFSSDNTTLEDTTLSCATWTCLCYSSMGSETQGTIVVFLCAIMLIHCAALLTVDPDTGATPTSATLNYLPKNTHCIANIHSTWNVHHILVIPKSKSDQFIFKPMLRYQLFSFCVVFFFPSSCLCGKTLIS